MENTYKVNFKKGLIGINGTNQFYIEDHIDNKHSFKILLSSDGKYSFIILPVEVKNRFLDYEDVASACHRLGMDLKNTEILLIVSMVNTAGENLLSVNLKAPVFVNKDKKEAVQLVMNSSKYDTNFIIDDYIN